MSALAVGLTASVLALAPFNPPRPPLEGVPTAKVRRVVLEAEVLASGQVASSNSTEIRCTLERLGGPGAVSSGGASTILSLIPEGSTVKEGDVLCELDGSSYAELVRRQQILVKQAEAEHEQAGLTLDVARIELERFRAGDVLQAEQQFRGQIALARSELTRQSDRLAWMKRMLAKGYSSAAQVSGDEQALRRTTFDLTQLVTAFRNYQRFTAPKDILFLQSQVLGAEATFDFQSIRLKREEDRLFHYQVLVDRCTVRAPHDGFVIYANRTGVAPRSSSE